jgi:hypothetical protein
VFLANPFLPPLNSNFCSSENSMLLPHCADSRLSKRLTASIQVARLLAHCVLIGSLAELLFSFCMQSVLAFFQMVDAITGKVMSSMVIVLALKVHCNT